MTKPKNKCTGCGGRKSDCPAIQDNYMCTRKKGHKGKHMACGSLTHKIRIWK